MILRAEDLKIEAAVLRPPGGQQVGSDSSVRVTHLPTGLSAVCATERSQHRNRLIAMDMLLGGLTSPHFR